MIVRELESWNVVHRKRVDNNLSWHFVAETNLIQMITHVVNQRETGMIAHVREQLQSAQEIAETIPDISESSLQRVKHLHRLSFLFQEILNVFLKTDNFDMLFLLEKIEEFKHTLLEQVRRDQNE